MKDKSYQKQVKDYSDERVEDFSYEKIGQQMKGLIEC